MSFQFASPWWLIALAIVPFIALRGQLWAKLSGQRMSPYHAPSLRASWLAPLRSNQTSWRVKLRVLPSILHLISISLLIVALARPQLSESQQIIRGEGIDIALALDISGSMAALDFQPQNRLEAAKQVIADFIDTRTFDRLGLVVFAREAFNQSPLTIDHNVLQRLLADVNLAPELGVRDGTAIGMGLANAAAMLQDSPSDSKVVILLTDGVNNAGQLDPITAAEAARALNVRVYTIGAAKPGRVPAPITDIFGRQEIVYQESVLDEATLEEIAEITGGLYFRAEDTDGLEAIYDQINKLERSNIEVRNLSRARELLWLALVPSLSLLVVAQGLNQTVLRRLP
jgi:Ca-activated chloride channel family protein